jgi:hypothetical protein
LLLSIDFLAEPDFQGFLNLAAMLGSQTILYSNEGRPPARTGHYPHLPCVTL